MPFKLFRLWGAVLVLLSLPCLLAPAQAQVPAVATAQEVRLIVRFRDGALVTQRHALSASAEGRSAAAVAQVLQQRADTLAQRHGVGMRAGRPLDARTQALRLSGLDAPTALRRLAADADVESVSIDHPRQALRVPNDPLFLPSSPPAKGPASGQWYLRAPDATLVSAINAPGAWDLSTGSPNAIVAVLDTGVRPEHPDLQGKLLPGYDFVSDTAFSNDGDGRDADATDPGDWVSSAESASAPFSGRGCSTTSSWHGTVVAGLVAAATNNGAGMAGLGWNSRVLPVRVLGKCLGYDSDIIAGMRWAAGLAVPGVPTNPTPAKVLNLSLGGTGTCSSAYTSAITEIVAAGKLIVAAAGNSVGHAVGVPANCPGVIAVGGLRHVGTKSGFSDVGPQIAISAPAGNCVNDFGVCVYPILGTSDTGLTSPVSSTYTNSTDDVTLGTSFSAPLVSGTAVLMLALRPDLSPAEVLNLLKASTRPFPAPAAGSTVATCRAPDSIEQNECHCTTSTCGAGMLDAFAAVQRVVALGSNVVPPAAAPVAVAGAATLTPAAGETVLLTGAASTVPTGASVAGYAWTVVEGGTLAQLSSAGSATPALQILGGGTVVVRLAVTDSRGVVSATDLRLAATGPAPAATSAVGGGGGGALGWPWLAGLAAAVLALRGHRRRG